MTDSTPTQTRPPSARIPLDRILVEGIRVAVAALRANWLRAALAVLGIGIGVGVVVTVAAMITGIRTQVMASFESSDPDNFLISPWDFSQVRIGGDGSGRAPWWDKPPISDEEIRRLQSLPAIQEAVAVYQFGAAIRYDAEWVRNVEWRGASSGWAAYSPGDFVAGRDFTPTEVNQARGVMVVSEVLAQDLFGQRDPIGMRVRVSAGRRATNELFTVIGVFNPGDNVFGDLAEHFAVIPYTAADKRLKARNRFTFLTIQVVPKEEYTGLQAQDQVVAALRSLRGLSPAEENNFAIIKSEQLVQLFDQLTGVFFLVMIALSSVGMLVGGVGVVGIMLISVTERTREIGVRKAIGATRREVLWQFLIEASLLTAVGGAAGLLLGWGTSSTIASLTPLPSRIPLWSVFAAIGLATFTGILFGLLPALRASKLDPVDALRFE